MLSIKRYVNKLIKGRGTDSASVNKKTAA